MSEFTSPPEFKEKLRVASSTYAPDPDPAFVNKLRSQLIARSADMKPQSQHSPLRPAWRITIAVLLVLIAIVLVIGPQKVAAAMKRMLGYIPGVGIVEQSAPIRILAEPVSVTRQGVTVSVTRATLTADKTYITYQVYGIPPSAYPPGEDVVGCFAIEYLRLPDGTKLDYTSGGNMGRGLPPIPADMNEATFVLPCIAHTLPGTVPEDWELPLRFVPAPPDLTVMPVIEILPSPEPVTTGTPEAPQDVVVESVIETGDGYILIGAFHPPHVSNDGWVQITSVPKITDANGQEIFYTNPNDIDLPSYTEPDAEPWAYEIKGSYLAYPLTITFSGVYITPADPQATAQFEFDTGPNPQAGQEWTLNKDIQIAGHTFRLVSVMSDSRGGYSFYFETSPDVNGVSVDIPGYTPNGGGGGGGAGLGSFSVGLSFPELPKGKLKVILSNLTIISGTGTWQGQWQPASPTKGTTSLYGITLAVDKYMSLDDGYYLIGHTAWSDDRISSVGLDAWAMKLIDTKGQEVPIEPASFSDVGIEQPESNQWIYRVHGKSLNGPLTLRSTTVDVIFKQPIKFTLDLRPYNFDGSDAQSGYGWKTGLIPLDVPELLATAFKAEYIKQGNMKGFRVSLEADPVIQSLPLSIESGVTGGTGAGSSESNRDQETGLLLSSVLTDGQISFPLTLSAKSASIAGRWETTWNPPFFP